MTSENVSVSRMQWFKERGLKYALAPAALIILYVFFGIFGMNYFSYPTLVNIIDASYYIGFISMGVTFVIISGGIDLSVGTVMMASALIGGVALKHGVPMLPSLLLIILVGTGFGFFNGLIVSRLKLPPFIATLGTMMISMGVGSIVSNVQSATFPIRGQPGGWYKNLFLYLSPEGGMIPTGAILLLLVGIICHLILSNTKLGRYTYAIGSNIEAARLSGVDVQKWQMMVYVISGATAGIGGISYAAIYTTVLPAQGQGFELYAIAAAVIGGTSLSGGVGTIWGTIIGVFIMSVLATGLPAMNLQAHWQTFFTGVIVIGAVLLDMYRTKKASEVRIETAADMYKAEMSEKIASMKRELSSLKASGDRDKVADLQKEIAAARRELKATFAAKKAEEKAEQARIRAEERAADHEFSEMLKHKDHPIDNI
ncbi:MAG TPA: ABC transporter permease [Rectinema sp.]|jgi:ribose transport system permease protein|nr:ABC transporter permease [Rectinema sp.]HNY98813.1 ABC transporter permease [Rectinema sp.]HOD58197.1 ABC transporter permease [Rectinema sp.]HOE75842.1 ABC transporter permease [Rectinema sp.]HOH05463.1 ABC transporter permease [Rectinema sp.]